MSYRIFFIKNNNKKVDKQNPEGSSPVDTVIVVISDLLICFNDVWFIDCGRHDLRYRVSTHTQSQNNRIALSLSQSRTRNPNKGKLNKKAGHW